MRLRSILEESGSACFSRVVCITKKKSESESEREREIGIGAADLDFISFGSWRASFSLIPTKHPPGGPDMRPTRGW